METQTGYFTSEDTGHITRVTLYTDGTYEEHKLTPPKFLNNLRDHPANPLPLGWED